MNFVIAQLLSSTALHPTVSDWFYRVKKNGGGDLSNTTIQATNRFYRGVVDNGLSSSLLSINVFAPDNITACRTPLVVWSGSNDPWVVVGGPTNNPTTNGLQGNRAAYFDTGIKPGAFMTSGSGLGAIYVTVDSKSFAETEYGTTDGGGGNALRYYHHYSDNITYVNMYGSFTQTTLSTLPNLTGLYTVSRTSTTRLDVYRANSSITNVSFMNDTTTQTNTPTIIYTLFVYGTNEAGAVNSISNKTISFSVFGKGISSTQVGTLFTLVQQLRKDFGGGFT